MNPFWKAAVEAASSPIVELDGEAFLAAIERAYRFEREPCYHLEPYPGWARKVRALGVTVANCPRCGADVRIPELPAAGPALSDA